MVERHYKLLNTNSGTETHQYVYQYFTNAIILVHHIYCTSAFAPCLTLRSVYTNKNVAQGGFPHSCPKY